MYNWSLLIALIAVVEPIACFSDRSLVNGRGECCELRTDTLRNHRVSAFQRTDEQRDSRLNGHEQRRETRRYELRDLRLFADNRERKIEARYIADDSGRSITPISDRSFLKDLIIRQEQSRDNHNEDERNARNSLLRSYETHHENRRNYRMSALKSMRNRNNDKQNSRFKSRQIHVTSRAEQEIRSVRSRESTLAGKGSVRTELTGRDQRRSQFRLFATKNQNNAERRAVSLDSREERFQDRRALRNRENNRYKSSLANNLNRREIRFNKKNEEKMSLMGQYYKDAVRVVKRSNREDFRQQIIRRLSRSTLNDSRDRRALLDETRREISISTDRLAWDHDNVRNTPSDERREMVVERRLNNQETRMNLLTPSESRKNHRSERSLTLGKDNKSRSLSRNVSNLKHNEAISRQINDRRAFDRESLNVRKTIQNERRLHNGDSTERNRRQVSYNEYEKTLRLSKLERDVISYARSEEALASTGKGLLMNWPFFLYTLQGIYICSVFMHVFGYKSSKGKKPRYGGSTWFFPSEVVKVD